MFALDGPMPDTLPPSPTIPSAAEFQARLNDQVAAAVQSIGRNLTITGQQLAEHMGRALAAGTAKVVETLRRNLAIPPRPAA